MATDRANVDYEREQEILAALRDSCADWVEAEASQHAFQPLPKVCAQCLNWENERLLHLADDSTWRRLGYCAARGAADLPQLPQNYAERCKLYEEEMPF
ncbi:MAG: hypothetical protein AB8B99_21800 [Phormidesmis sp.]